MTVIINYFSNDCWVRINNERNEWYRKLESLFLYSLPFKCHLVTEEEYKIRQLGLELFSIPFNKVNTECNYNLIDTCDLKTILWEFNNAAA